MSYVRLLKNSKQQSKRPRVYCLVLINEKKFFSSENKFRNILEGKKTLMRFRYRQAAVDNLIKETFEEK